MSKQFLKVHYALVWGWVVDKSNLMNPSSELPLVIDAEYVNFKFLESGSTVSYQIRPKLSTSTKGRLKKEQKI